MTVKEFSNEFDISYNSIATNAAPGIDLYEKSVFLTKAQNELIKNYFNPKGNKYQEGFDGNQKRQIDFLDLIVVKELEVATSAIELSITKLDHRSKLFLIPDRISFILNESVNGTINGIDKIINIKAINFQEYDSLMLKPFKLPYKNQGWRLINKVGADSVFELIIDPNLTVNDYILRYVKKPAPIILVDLTTEFVGEGLSIEGITTTQTCELEESIHPEVLQRAVEIAKAFYEGNINSIIELGKRSE